MLYGINFKITCITPDLASYHSQLVILGLLWAFPAIVINFAGLVTLVVTD
jgi:hypothetical protein